MKPHKRRRDTIVHITTKDPGPGQVRGVLLAPTGREPIFCFTASRWYTSMAYSTTGDQRQKRSLNHLLSMGTHSRGPHPFCSTSGVALRGDAMLVVIHRFQNLTNGNNSTRREIPTLWLKRSQIMTSGAGVLFRDHLLSKF